MDKRMVSTQLIPLPFANETILRWFIEWFFLIGQSKKSDAFDWLKFNLFIPGEPEKSSNFQKFVAPRVHHRFE